MKLLLYFSDAFAWQYCQQTDYMADFWKVRRPVKTLLGYSSTIMPAILSGRLPRDTGIWTEYFYEPRPQHPLAAFFTLHPLLQTPANMARLVLFRLARKAGRPEAHTLRVPLQFAHLFKRHPIDYRNFPPVALDVPQLDSIFQHRGSRFEMRYLGGRPDLRTELAYLRDRKGEVDVFFYHDHTVDAAGHRAGAMLEAVQVSIDAIDRFLRAAWDELGGEAGAQILLFSDHGMTTVTRTFDVYAALSQFKIGRDYLMFADSTFVRIWFLDETKRQAIRDALAHAPGHFLTDAELHSFGINFNHNRYGDAVLIADEGVIFHPNYISPSFFRTKTFPDRGMHGFSPDAPSSYGILAYRGHLSADLPAEVPITDIFHLICAMTGASEMVQSELTV